MLFTLLTRPHAEIGRQSRLKIVWVFPSQFESGWEYQSFLTLKEKDLVNLLKDIEILESALIGINEGASDEKYAAVYSLEKLLLEKKDMVSEFEAEYANRVVTQ